MEHMKSKKGKTASPSPSAFPALSAVNQADSRAARLQTDLNASSATGM
jgi:hypothetical protein